MKLFKLYRNLCALFVALMTLNVIVLFIKDGPLKTMRDLKEAWDGGVKLARAQSL